MVLNDFHKQWGAGGGGRNFTEGKGTHSNLLLILFSFYMLFYLFLIAIMQF